MLRTPTIATEKITFLTHTRGALLAETLIALTLLSGLLLIGTQSILAGLVSAKNASEKNPAVMILQETADAVRAASNEQWQNLYGLLRTPTHYYPLQSSGKWVLFLGDETITVNDIVYTRYFTVDHVSRNTLTREIESTYNSTRDDPGTQKITMVVSWKGNRSLSQVEYLTRWRNKVCVQTNWSSPTSTGVKTCPDSSYDTSTDITGGATLEITPIP